MGHTVVLGFDKASIERIHTLTAPFDANKIPFGRDCDREAANKELDYHMTLYHWPKTMDEYCLSRVKEFRSIPCQVRVNGTCVMPAEEGSWLLYFDIAPTESFLKLKSLFESDTGFFVSGFYHVTVAVSKDYDEIHRLDDHICKNQSFPFLLNGERVDLYHIWKPTRKIMSF